MNTNGNKSQNEEGKGRRPDSESSFFPGFSSFFPDFVVADRYFPATQMASLMQESRQHQPAVNIIENDHEFRIEVSAPGMNKNDFHVDMEENRITISAEHRFQNEESSGDEVPEKGKAKNKEQARPANERYTRREFGYSQFSRSFMLPETVDAEKIKARYKDGILCLTLPKREEEKQKKQRRRIEIS